VQTLRKPSGLQPNATGGADMRRKSAVEELAETIDLHAAVGSSLKSALDAAERAKDAASSVSLVSLMHTFSSSTKASCSKVQEGLEALKAASERQSGVARTLRRQSRYQLLPLQKHLKFSDVLTTAAGVSCCTFSGFCMQSCLMRVNHGLLLRCRNAPPASPGGTPVAASQDVCPRPTMDPDSQRSTDTGVHLPAAQHTGDVSGTPAILTPPPKEAGRRKRRRQEPTTPAANQEDAPVVDLGAHVLHLRQPSIDIPGASGHQRCIHPARELPEQ
jgi:hypothetical protein